MLGSPPRKEELQGVLDRVVRQADRLLMEESARKTPQKKITRRFGKGMGGTLPKRRPVQRPPVDVEQLLCTDLWKRSSTIFCRPARFLHWENAQQQHKHNHHPDGVQARGKHTQTCTQHRADLVPKRRVTRITGGYNVY